MIYALISLFIPISIGYLNISYFCRESDNTIRVPAAIRVFSGAGLGFGISSSLFFIFMVIGAARYIIFTEAVILMIFLYLNIRTRAVSAISTTPASVPKGKIARFLQISFYGIILAALVTFVCIAIQCPYGDADGLSMWNMRARFLFRAGQHWRDAFSGVSVELTLPHKDYPLLLAGMIARTWIFTGYDSAMIPIAVNMVFALSTAGLLYASLRMFQDRTQAYLASVVLLGTPFFMWYSAVQYADVPLGFYFFATILMFYLQDHYPGKKNLFIILAGIFAAMSAWTKNEGLLFLLCMVITRFLSFVILKKDRKSYFRELGFFIAGAMPIAVIIVYFKISIAPSNDLTPQDYSVLFRNLLDIDRHLQIIKALILFISNFGYWTFGLPFIHFGYCSIPLLLLFYIPFAGINTETDKKHEIIASFIALGLMMIGYHVIYLITPHDLEWHLAASLRRLLLQLWPAYLFTYFMMIHSPTSYLINSFLINQSEKGNHYVSDEKNNNGISGCPDDGQHVCNTGNSSHSGRPCTESDHMACGKSIQL